MKEQRKIMYVDYSRTGCGLEYGVDAAIRDKLGMPSCYREAYITSKHSMIPSFTMTLTKDVKEDDALLWEKDGLSCVLLINQALY